MGVQFDDKGKFFTDVVSKATIPATIQTATHKMHGVLHIRQGKRIKDELNLDERFLAVTDVVVFNSQGDIQYQAGFMALNINHVVWVIPDEENIGE